MDLDTDSVGCIHLEFSLNLHSRIFHLSFEKLRFIIRQVSSHQTELIIYYFQKIFRRVCLFEFSRIMKRKPHKFRNFSISFEISIFFFAIEISVAQDYQFFRFPD